MERINEDIRNIVPDEIPDFDILCAGFPCQPFSQAGYKRGFDDFHNSERGNLFFNIADIIEVKKPKAYFLENVRGLINHDGSNQRIHSLFGGAKEILAASHHTRDCSVKRANRLNIKSSHRSIYLYDFLRRQIHDSAYASFQNDEQISNLLAF